MNAPGKKLKPNVTMGRKAALSAKIEWCRRREPCVLYELPRLHDWGEPSVELLVRGDLIQETTSDEPHLAAVAHDRVASIECRSRGPVDRRRGALLDDARRLVELEFLVGDLRAAIARDINLEPHIVRRVLEGGGEPASGFLVGVHL
jgi:hypothetical protein